MDKEKLNLSVQLASGALAGGMVKDSDEAIAFVEECYDKLSAMVSKRTQEASDEAARAYAVARPF